MEGFICQSAGTQGQLFGWGSCLKRKGWGAIWIWKCQYKKLLSTRAICKSGLVCIDPVLRMYWNTYSQYSNTNQAPFNTDEYTPIRTNTSEDIVHGLVCIDPVLRLYWNTYSQYPIHFNTSEYTVNGLVCIKKKLFVIGQYSTAHLYQSRHVYRPIRMCMYWLVLSSLLTYQRHEKTRWGRTKSRHIPERWALHLAFPQKNARLKQYIPIQNRSTQSNTLKYLTININAQVQKNTHNTCMQSIMANPFGVFAEPPSRIDHNLDVRRIRTSHQRFRRAGWMIIQAPCSA